MQYSCKREETSKFTNVSLTLSRLVGAINSQYAMLPNVCCADQNEVSALDKVQTRLAFSRALRSRTWLGELTQMPPIANDHQKCGDWRRKKIHQLKFFPVPSRSPTERNQLKPPPPKKTKSKPKSFNTKKIPRLFCIFEITGGYRVSESALNQRS